MGSRAPHDDAHTLARDPAPPAATTGLAQSRAFLSYPGCVPLSPPLVFGAIPNADDNRERVQHDASHRIRLRAILIATVFEHGPGRGGAEEALASRLPVGLEAWRRLLCVWAEARLARHRRSWRVFCRPNAWEQLAVLAEAHARALAQNQL